MTEPTTMETLIQRLARLEREVRWWKFVGGTAIVVTILILFVAATTGTPQEVRARSFVLIGEDGQPRGILKSDSAGSRLLLSDKEGKGQASISVDDVGMVGISLKYNPEGRPSAEKLREIARTLRSGSVETLLGEGLGLAKGHSVHLTVMRDALSSFSLKVDNNNIAALSVLGRGVPSLSLSDDSGKERAVLGHVSLQETRIGTAVERAASSLVLLDKDGKVIWKAP